MKGRRGGVVLVVHSEGNMVFGFSSPNLNPASDTFFKIDVYSAPHLSVPCVLQAPISTWELCTLPSEFAKPYDFAAKYLQVVRRRTPMVCSSAMIYCISLTRSR
jgi:hypothetical protein